MHCFIRRMNETDLDEILELEHRLFSCPWNRPMYEEELRDFDAYVMLNPDTGEITGYLCGHQVLDEYEITNVGVKPEYQGRGLGKHLLTFLLNSLSQHGVRYYFLEVRVTNEPALKLYTGLGFKQLQIRRNYYRDPVEDALVMGLEIIPPDATPASSPDAG